MTLSATKIGQDSPVPSQPVADLTEQNFDGMEQEVPNPRLTTTWKSIIIILTLLGIVLAMNYVFFWNIGGVSLLENSFLYLLTACFLPIALIVAPARKSKAKEKQKPGVPLYDIALILAFVTSAALFSFNGVNIVEHGWAFVSPLFATIASFIYWVIILEVLRRTAGWFVAVLALAVSLYPLVAGTIPIGFLQGVPYSLDTLAQVHVMGTESILGLPLQTAGTILVGFLLFGVVLQHTGGAVFFHDVSMALFGRYRGGSAKVTVASSAALGMMSGSAVSNVLTTGPLTIPAMRRSGFSRKTAGAIEATASSGGSITPPIMGTAAFLMVAFAGVSYTEIIIAAAIPAFLYFLGIFIQIDGYSAINNIRGTAKDRLPKLASSLFKGWPYIIALGLLTILLIIGGSEAQIPYWVVGWLFIVALLKPNFKFGPQEWANTILDVGKTLGQIIGIIAGVGLILGGLSATGVALSLSRDMVALVGENVILILIMGAVACFILGMGLTISAAYVFLAIVMVPSLTALGVDIFAAHLFVIYWASVSYITPPVGLAAFAAAGISKASPMATSVEAMRLGAVKYVVPFGFALNPALVAQGTLTEIIISGLFSIVAVFALACALSGWLLIAETKISWLVRIPLAIAGFAMFLPQLPISLAGLAIVAAIVTAKTVTGRRSSRSENILRDEKVTHV